MKASFKFSYFTLLVASFVLLFAASPLFAQVDAGAILGYRHRPKRRSDQRRQGHPHQRGDGRHRNIYDECGWYL